MRESVGAATGVKLPTISGILSGAQKDMRWQNGERLRELHVRRKEAANPAARQEAA